MKRQMSKNIRLGLLFVGVTVLFAVVNLLLTLVLGDVYFDKTPDKRYSLSLKSEKFLEQNDEEITIRLYISKDLSEHNPVLGQYAEYVRKLLRKYQQQSRDKINLSIIEVKPFSSVQAAAEKAGIKVFDFGDGRENIYLGATFTNTEGATKVIEQFWPERKSVIEDDISRILSILAEKKTTIIGVISPFFDAVDKGTLRFAGNNMAFVNQLAIGGYQVVALSDTAMEIPVEVDAVLVLYPVDLDKIAVYALDQYLMRGGKIIVMLDAFADERYREEDEYINYNSGLKEFLQNMGVEYSEFLLAGDNVNSQQVILDGKKLQYPLQLVVNSQQMVSHKITEELSQLKLNHSGFFTYQSRENLKTKVLFATGNDSGMLPAGVLTDLSYDNLLKNYVVTDKKYPLALLLEGKFNSLFQAPIISDIKILEGLHYSFLSIPQEEGTVVLVADSDMLTQSTWLDYSKKTDSPYQVMFTSDNLKFVRNVLDYLTGRKYLNVATKKDAATGNLSVVLYQKATNVFAEEKIKENHILLELRENILLMQEKIASLPVSSIKQLKELEQLKRKEMSTEENLRRINYQIKEKYQQLFDWFALLTVVVMPFIGCLLIGAVYWIYNRRIKSKIGEYVK